ncbi:N-formylglutamate deformylase [Litoreibacter halocynthiae]|uniref:N-formylglutamate deformylase n=1 Tax=Litoreibacter halocynthiae TaxID=1242689 RepID=A0A4R7LEG2_9RHOB|nr:N-formylglutamate amidohydrolase [Litoreibacter halocynthiae]TDT72952.1 N-formylglutamate deformylase [Litoreibacter halocynthiae]
MTNDAYTLTLPEVQTSCMVFASPHSGRNYSHAFLRRTVLDDLQIRSSEDAFVDRLVAPAAKYGSPFLAANMPRAFLDLNRACDELDPAVVQGVRRPGHNPRIASGLGVIPRVVANGRAIYAGKLSMEEASTRIEQYWHPYHKCLGNLMEETNRTFGRAVLVDFHSMPHEAVQSVALVGFARPEVVLGDRFGAAAGGDIVDRIETIFLEAGLRVSRNAPFAGAYITQVYGRPSRGHHAIQIEIDRALYMNEQFVRPNGNFDSFCQLMEKIVAEISDLGRQELPLAAE